MLGAFAPVPTIEEAIIAAVAKLLHSGRDFRDLPKHDGRFIVLGVVHMKEPNDILCLKKDDPGNYYTYTSEGSLKRHMLYHLRPGELDTLAAALLSQGSH